MKKIIAFLLSIACGSAIQSKAQSTPLYVCQPPDPMDILPTVGSGPYTTQTQPPNKIISQHIYYQMDFLNMSSLSLGLPNSGTITDLYLKMRSQKKGSLLKNLTIKINDTTLWGFSQGQPLVQSGLTTVFYDSLYTLTDSLADGDWWRIPLQFPYHYSFSTHPDSCKSLIIELYGLATKPEDFDDNSFFFMYRYSNYKRPFSIIFIDTVTQADMFANQLYLIGFNPLPDPVGVDEVSNTQLSLYPNPTKDYLYLSATPRPNTAYTITDITGRQLLQGVVKDNAISVQALQPGLYLLRIGTEVLRFLKED